MSLEEYKLRLSKMDWYYQYTDDLSVWERGQTEYEALERAARKIDPDKSIWKSIAPKGF